MGQCHAVFFKTLHSFSAVVIHAFHFIDDVVFLPKLFIVIDATLGDRGNKKGHLVARADAKGKHQSVCWPESVVFTIRTVIPKKEILFLYIAVFWKKTQLLDSDEAGLCLSQM